MMVLSTGRDSVRRTEVLHGVRMMKFRDVFGRCEEGNLSQLEAAELLGVNERTFRRWCRRYEEEGEAGLLDRRLGKPSPKGVPVAEADLFVTLDDATGTIYSAFLVEEEGTFSSLRGLA